jgi:hypothetical protein
MNSFRLLALLALLAATAVPAGAQAGSSLASRQVHVNRQDLQARLAQQEQVMSSPSQSSRARNQARAEAEAIRRRLQEGDMQVGEQVVLFVQGNEALSDTFTVSPGRVLYLPNVGEVQLAGLLRSEVPARLSEHLGRYLVNPVVRVQTLMRVSVAGQVGKPGYYSVPPESLVSDVLMVAGGPTAGADMRKVFVERQGTKVVEGTKLQQAMAEGQTLDQMNFYPGDQIYVPERRESLLRDPWTLVRAATATAAVVGLIVRVF